MGSRFASAASAEWPLFGIGVCSIATLFFLFPFSADDAYIYMRYGANLIDTGDLVFNADEPINTMTSPLLALIYALLYALTGIPDVAYKFVSLVCLATVVWWVARSVPGPSWLRASLVASVSLSPCVLIWTVGGMETPVAWIIHGGRVWRKARGRPRAPAFRCRRLMAITGRYSLGGLPEGWSLPGEET